MKLLRNSQIKRKMSKKIKLFTLKDSPKSSLLHVRKWNSGFPSPPSSNPREAKEIQEVYQHFGQTFLWELRMTILTVNWRREFWKENLPKECTWCLLIICEGHQLFSGSMLFTSIQEEEDNLDVQHGSLMFFESFHFIQEFLRNLRWFSSIQSLTCFLKRLTCLLSCSD